MKSAMYIYRANRVESLLDSLTEVLREPLASPLAPECIIVQSKGMATWLGMQLSGRFGVWGNPDFPHPRQFVQRLLRATLGEEGDRVQRYSRERLAFVICTLLDACRHDPDFSPLTSYLADGPLSKQLQLARQIAHLFDQYAVYRPEMILAWEEGENRALGHELAEDLWQPKLWRMVVAQLGCCSPARLMLRARQGLAAGTIPFPHLLPTRVSLFGIDTLPTVYLGIMGELAQILPVHLHLFSPAEGYFGDLHSPAEAHRALARLPAGHDPADLYLEVGHPLLGSMGGMARDFQEVLEGSVSYVEAGEQYLAHDAPQTMLEVVQNDILHLSQRSPASGNEPPQILSEDDASLRIHACHSRLREVEVLQDQLLGLFQDDPDLAPRDIVVMLPEVAAYAPLIEAVFGLPFEDKRFIPYRIADRSLLSGAPLIEVFFRFLQMAPKRMSASEVLELLACEAILLNFSLTSEELPKIRLWVEKTGIRWGIDELHREKLQQPKERQNTWRFGFDRLALGYAVRSDGAFLGDILPYEEIEGQGAELAGRFIHFCETLFAQGEKLSAAMEIPAWQDVLGDLLQALFLADSPQAWQLQKIRDSLAQITLEAQDGGFNQPLDLNGITILLKEKLTAQPTPQGFLEGGLTFCGMLPMRSIPFKVICLLGMNDGAFPRMEHPQSFDLIARYPQRGDRAKRNDDRYIFLEALLACRSKFLLFYLGNNLRDGKALPPSVVVEELLDTLAESFSLAPDASSPEPDFDARRKALAARIVLRHPLQPFSQKYFSGADQRLCSFGAEYCRAAQAKQTGIRRKYVFLPAPLPPPVAAPASVSLSDLSRYLSQPVRWFLENRLGFFLQERTRELQDREPIHLDSLEKYQLSRDLLAMQGEGLGSPKILLARWRGEGRIPLGQAAQAVFSEIKDTVRPIVEELLNYGPGDTDHQLPPLRREIRLSQDLTLHGELTGRYPSGHLSWTNSLLHGKILLPVWLEHLFLSAVSPEDQRCETTLIGRGREKGTAQVLRFSPVPEATSLLLDLATLFGKGLSAPLSFFPKSGLVFAQALHDGKGSEEELLINAFAKAEEEYLGNDFTPGEGEDPYCRQLFAETLPVSPGYTLYAEASSPPFAELASRIFTPMLNHMEEL
ncbi:exodeoxyribonuclease V subunit gamma [Thiovibrio frasassiensis]|uniref:Exodeoxyribonuclease V subunit gamma n=1 Tax=Thiovibrio frasassiensis TaxID=2984131 RepID=A0A9X4MIA4_9BACT|nr:exodeoxyribonuclease V subunit gamma [Thiovibrio frasassiensis]MDG4476861.1 exodeoxyribonuclease V subunit gamma [Thiovibrio frasassiensis]